jgi:putative transcriptional regulator
VSKKTESTSLRKQMGLTQSQLAHELGVTFGTVNQWENGRHRPHPFLRKQLLEMKASLDKSFASRLTKEQTRASRKRRQPV